MAKKGSRQKILTGTWKGANGRPLQALYSPYNFHRQMECGHHKPLDRDQQYAYCTECHEKV
jgi:hypothetical protein